MIRPTVTAADLPDGTPAPSCMWCGRTPRAEHLWGIADGMTTNRLDQVQSWCCSTCFTAPTKATGKHRRRREDDETAHYRSTT